ncbi:MAG: hypothetical protein AAF493_21315 [Pseudomonadota bacterium]
MTATTIIGVILIVLGLVDVLLGNFVVGPKLRGTPRGGVITAMTIGSGILMQLAGAAMLLGML